MERANYGPITYFLMPKGIVPSAQDTYDGKSQTYYNAACVGAGKCSLAMWNMRYNNVSASFPLSCMPATGFLSGQMWVDPMNTAMIRGLHMDSGDNYGIITINVQAKSCTITPLTALPPHPRIVISVQSGYKSGSVFVSVTSDVYNAIVVYDNKLNFFRSVKTQFLFEDIFVREM